MSEIAIETGFIKLETNDSCYLGKIQEIALLKDRIVIFDSSVKSFFLFDKTGNFIKSFNVSGKGPGECVKCRDVIINEDFIHIFDLGLKKIITYDLEGKLISDSKVDFFATNFARINNQLVFYIPDYQRPLSNGYSLYVADYKGKVKKKLLPRSIDKVGESFYSINKLKDCILFWETPVDTVYMMDNNLKLHPDLILIYQNRPEEIRYNQQTWVSRLLEHFVIWRIWSTERYRFFHITDQKSVKYFYYDHKEGIGKSIPFNSSYNNFVIEDDLSGMAAFLPEFMADTDVLISTIEIADLKKLLADSVIKPYQGKLTNNQIYIKTITESSIDDNPILQYMKVKN